MACLWLSLHSAGSFRLPYLPPHSEFNPTIPTSTHSPHPWPWPLFCLSLLVDIAHSPHPRPVLMKNLFHPGLHFTLERDNDPCVLRTPLLEVSMGPRQPAALETPAQLAKRRQPFNSQRRMWKRGSYLLSAGSR